MFNQIKNWNNARGLLNKGYDHNLEVRMLREEDLERFNGISESNIHEEIDALDDLIVVASGGIYKLNNIPHGFGSATWGDRLVEITPTITKFMESELNTDRIILLNHLIYLCVKRLTALGYAYQKTMNETLCEINSRVGKIIDGKFQKDTSEAAMANWYKANYTQCLLINKSY